jgi:flagellar hook protein FlgE
MGLQSALSTALTDMTAAETTIDVTGNNVANANTVGFKESKVSFATQFLATQSIGSAPTDNRGGTNPRQVGLGAKVSEISPNFTQGTIQISANPLDLAIQGDGFFIVQGNQGEHLYTRNGQFKTNANNEIVTVTGQRVLGYTVDSNFTIQPTGLSPLQIPLGAAAVAQATENVVMKGALNPNSAVGNTPGIIESAIFSDGTKPVPPDGTTASAQSRPLLGSLTFGFGTTGSMGPGTYTYRFTFADGNGNESPASVLTSQVILGGANNEIDMTTVPQPPAGSIYTKTNIYRTNVTGVPADSDFRLAGTVQATDPPVFNDLKNDTTIAGEAKVNDEGLGDGNYSYYITYIKYGGSAESRPAARIGPITAEAALNPRVLLQDIPMPDSSSEYDGVRIYRNLANDPNAFRQVEDIKTSSLPGPTFDYVDHSPDSDITANKLINLDGPQINLSLPLVKLVMRNESTYSNPFQEGELSFTGEKGGRKLDERTLTITSTTTVQDLLTFMDQAMGVVTVAPESTFPTTDAEGNTLDYGGSIDGSRLKFVSNMGVENALGVSRSSFKFTPAGSTTATSLQLPFSSVQKANGEGATANFVVYDSLGSPVNIRMSTVLEEVSSTGAKFRWIATSGDNLPDLGVSTLVGTGVITTDSSGKFLSATNETIDVDRGETPAASPLEFKLDFSQVTGLSQKTNTLSASSQDGFPAGVLTSFIITETGKIQGVFSNGSSRDLGQLQMATFSNPSGLEQVGENMFKQGVNSGLPIQSDPGSQGAGSVTTGAVELSNTDIGQNLIELILASTQYRGGARVITAVQQLLDELLALRR